MNEEQLQEWVEAAEGIGERFGLDKALGYLIGEKFYNIVQRKHFAQARVREIEEQRQQPNYNPIREFEYGGRKSVTNLDEVCAEEKEVIRQCTQLLGNFSRLIQGAFEAHEIHRYMDSHPRLGVHGHVSTDEQYDFLVRSGAVEHSIETEIEDALAFGEILKYFGRG